MSTSVRMVWAFPIRLNFRHYLCRYSIFLLRTQTGEGEDEGEGIGGIVNIIPKRGCSITMKVIRKEEEEEGGEAEKGMTAMSYST